MTTSTMTLNARGASAFTRAPVPPRSTDDPGSPAPSPFPDQHWAQAIDDLLALRSLEDDWDGQGAPAPHPFIVDTALRFALAFERGGQPPPDFAIAGVNGTVFFDWHLSTGYLEIEVVSPDYAEGRWLREGSHVAEQFILARPS